jgi:prepilin-type N-terminal cleavage/methylation domain-containing protein
MQLNKTIKEQFLQKREKGFTIVELFVVLAIITILLGASAWVVSKTIRRERVISETDKLVSLLKEAQKYSMINSYYKKDGLIQKRHYGVRIARNSNQSGANNEARFNISLVWKNVNSNNYEGEVTDKSYSINNIKIYKISPRANNQSELIDNETIYFNDMALTTDNMTLRITDVIEEYKRNIAISQVGHINVESPE